MPEDLTPQREARLRRLLAQARHEEPMPTDVADRLDRVLDRLAADEPGPVVPPEAGQPDRPEQPEQPEQRDPPAGPRSVVPVVDLGTVRRRRRAAALLLAAAVVVVGAVGLGHALGSAGGGADSAPDSAPARAGAAAAGPTSRGGTTTDSAPDSAPDSAAGSRTDGTSPPAGPVLELRASTFVRQVRGLDLDALDDAHADAVPAPSATQSGHPSGRTLQQPSYACAGGDFGAGQRVRVLYDGVPAVLVYRPARGSTRVVELLRCGNAQVLRSVTLRH